jgi:hypothetical protein
MKLSGYLMRCRETFEKTGKILMERLWLRNRRKGSQREDNI